MTTRLKQSPLLIIILLSISLRVGVAFYLGDVVDAPPLLADQRSYHALGVSVISGHEFSFNQPWYPFIPANTPTAHWSFLYSLFVAAVYALFGVHPLAVRVVQAILGGILLPLMMVVFTRRAFPQKEKLALLAAALSAVYFYFILYAATLMTETFYIVAVLFSLERALALVERPTLKRGLMLGIGLGLAALLRQSILPWVAVLTVWLCWAGWRTGNARRMIAASGAAFGVLALSLLPFTLRNYQVYGTFLLLNSNAGYALYSSQHPMHGTDFREFDAAPLPADLHGSNEAEWDRDLMQRGIGFVLADPARYGALSLSRVPDFFEFWPTADTTVINNLGRVGSFGLFLPFMLYGLWLALRQARPGRSGTSDHFIRTPLGLIVLFSVFYSLVHILTWAMPRYRLPIDAVLLPCAALALINLYRRFRVRQHSGTRLELKSLTP